jgi:hypothetical protein
MVGMLPLRLLRLGRFSEMVVSFRFGGSIGAKRRSIQADPRFPCLLSERIK